MDGTILKNFLVPGFFSFFLIFLGFILLLIKKKSPGKYFIIFGLILFSFFSTTFGSDFLIGPLEDDFMVLSADRLNDAEIIVVLSGGRKADALRSSEVIRISSMKNHNASLIVSGTEPLNPKSELSLIEFFFISRGVPSDNIIVEDKSKNTRENAEKVFKKIGEEPFFLVTSAYHMKRAFSEFEKLGAKPIPAPTDFRKKGSPYGFWDYFPNSGNLRNSDLAIHEHLGILYYNIFD